MGSYLRIRPPEQPFSARFTGSSLGSALVGTGWLGAGGLLQTLLKSAASIAAYLKGLAQAAQAHPDEAAKKMQLAQKGYATPAATNCI